MSHDLDREAELQELKRLFEEEQKVARASREATVALLRKADALLSKD
jgi:hypothetical protein